MGCDIHIVLEKRFEGHWVGVHACPYIAQQKQGTPYVDYVGWPIRSRNYEFFANLAGVRGSGPEPKGMPVDASLLAQMKAEEWGNDGHSHSYCSLEDFIMADMQTWDEPLKLAAIQRKMAGKSDDVKQNAYYQFSIDDTDDLSNYRVVFWFDN